MSNYQVRFRDTSGNVTHVLAGVGSEHGGLTSITCENVVNGVGSHAITIKGDLSMADEIGLDYIAEIWRKPPGSSAWVQVYVGLHRTWVWSSDSKGEEQFTSYGHGLNGLLSRRIIAAYAGSAGSDKTGKAEQVIKAYVNENLGPGAAAGRQFPGMTVQASGSGGNDWQGSRSWRNLLEVCQDLAYAGGGDFQIISTGPATFEFRWYTGQLGTSRIIGSSTPIVFSPQRNNMLQPVLSVNHGQEFNVVYVLGPGEEAARLVIVASNAAAVALSPWNRIEVARQATNESTPEALADVGVAELRSGVASDAITFSVVQTPECAYGVHYFLGDIISALYRKRVDKKIVRVTVNVSADKEDIQVELADVP